MKWKLVWSTAALLLFVSMAVADTFTAIITEVKDGKVTFYKAMFNKAEKKMEKQGDKTTLPAADDVKVSKGKFDKEAKKFVAGDVIAGGLKAKVFSDIPEKGVVASITTDADNKKITAINVFGGGKKKKE